MLQKLVTSKIPIRQIRLTISNNVKINILALKRPLFFWQGVKNWRRAYKFKESNKPFYAGFSGF